jgi:hypothetical protein
MAKPSLLLLTVLPLDYFMNPTFGTVLKIVM